MTEPWRKSDVFNSNQPCMHALVIGTSYYTYLPQNPGDPPPDGVRETLGLGQATTPASSALTFARWLESDYYNPDAPMGSIRLLVSPSQEEKDQHTALANSESTVLNANTNNVKSALRAWKQDCERNRDNVAVFFVSGHGVNITKDDSIVLLEDFGNPVENILGCAMDIGGIWRGMSNNRAAKTQFYFVDACRIKPSAFKKYEHTPAGVTLDSEETTKVEAAPIYYAAAPSSFALGEPGRGTLFCQALLDCFKLHGVEAPDSNGRWVVTTSSLKNALEQRVSAIAESHDEEQVFDSGGRMRNRIFHVLREPPYVPLHISLIPENASQFAKAKLWDGYEPNNVIFDEAQFTPSLDTQIPGGLWVLSISIPNDVSDYQSKDSLPVAAFPPDGWSKEIKV